MGGWESDSLAFINTGSANDERNIDIFFNSTGLTRRQSVLAKMEAVIASVDQICIGQNIGMVLKCLYDAVNKFVNSL